MVADKQYLQLITVASNMQFYSTKGVNPGSTLKTGMVRVSLNNAYQIMKINETNVQSTKLTVSNLTTPIEITIPFSGSINPKMTLD